MAKKKQEIKKSANVGANVHITGAGEVMRQQITDTLRENYMPYAMSVIVSRALPEIDGLKPSHRKLLYTMYKMGLLTGGRTKSANVVGATMRLNPHGDQAIYETMVRLSRGCEALLHPLVDSKGNFGKAYSRDMAYAASRYTEVKLDPICAELFRDIDKDTVDFVPNYDNTTTEPVLLPVAFPSILANSTVGIAVSMASSICSFNLQELCETTIALIRNPAHEIIETLKAPDFAGGGSILYDEAELRKIYETGRGSIRVRAKYSFDKENHCIDVTEIPPTTTVEAIMDKIVDLIKQNRVREIADMRDETDLSGLKLTIDLKRGVDPEKLMQKLFKFTPLEDAYSANFNLLIGGMPKVMGVREILEEWTAFRMECIRRRIGYELTQKKDKLHLLKGLARILLDIDRAIQIIRQTEEESEVVPNLMIGFGIDKVQAEYVAEIRLRHLNRAYILKRTQETEQLKADIAEMEEILGSARRIKGLIIEELKEIIKKYAKPRRTMLLYLEEQADEVEEETVEDYPVHLFMTKQGYLKKVTPQSLRMSGEHKLKEDDEILYHVETTNSKELLFFSDRCQVYKSRISDFAETRISQLGDFIPAKLGFDEGERFKAMVVTGDYAGYVLFVFVNGKVAKVPLSAYQTKTKRKKLTGAYSDKAELVAVFCDTEEKEYLLTSSARRRLLFHSAMLTLKTTKNTQGVSVMTLKKNHFIESAEPFDPDRLPNAHRYRARNIPAAGAVIRAEDVGEQMTL